MNIALIRDAERIIATVAADEVPQNSFSLYQLLFIRKGSVNAKHSNASAWGLEKNADAVTQSVWHVKRERQLRDVAVRRGCLT